MHCPNLKNKIELYLSLYRAMTTEDNSLFKRWSLEDNERVTSAIVSLAVVVCINNIRRLRGH